MCLKTRFLLEALRGRRPSPTSPAALQRLLVAQQQLRVEGVAILPEGDPCRVSQPLRTAAVVVRSSGRRGPCGGAGLRKWPSILPGTTYTLPWPWSRQVALTPANPTHGPLQLGVTAGGAPGPIHVHVGTAPRLLGLPIPPAHVAQRLLRDPGVPPGALGTRGSWWKKGDIRVGVEEDKEGNQGSSRGGRQERRGCCFGSPPRRWPAQSRVAHAALGQPE